MKHVDWRGALLELQKIVHDYGPKEIADILGISVNSLYKQVDPNYNLEINPQDPENPDDRPRYKLGFKTLCRICQITARFGPVSTMLNPMGRGVFTYPDNKDMKKAYLRLAADADRESGEALQAVLAALENGHVDRQEAQYGIEQCDEAMEAWADLRARFKKSLDENPDHNPLKRRPGA